MRGVFQGGKNWWARPQPRFVLRVPRFLVVRTARRGGDGKTARSLPSNPPAPDTSDRGGPERPPPHPPPRAGGWRRRATTAPPRPLGCLLRALGDVPSHRGDSGGVTAALAEASTGRPTARAAGGLAPGRGAENGAGGTGGCCRELRDRQGRTPARSPVRRQVWWGAGRG